VATAASANNGKSPRNSRLADHDCVRIDTVKKTVLFVPGSCDGGVGFLFHRRYFGGARDIASGREQKAQVLICSLQDGVEADVGYSERRNVVKAIGAVVVVAKPHNEINVEVIFRCCQKARVGPR
jgi:hypothetical protein